MMRSIDGQPYFHATKPNSVRHIAPSDVYEPIQVEDMSTRRLRNKLCGMGTRHCAECGLCAFGREYAKRKG